MKPSRGEKAFWWAAVVLVLAGAWFYFGHLHGRDAAEVAVYSNLGGALGPLASLLSAVALFAALHGISLQREDLALQRRELELQRDELRQSREAMQQQAKAAEETASVQRDLAKAQDRLATAQDLANEIAVVHLHQLAMTEECHAKEKLAAIHVQMGENVVQRPQLGHIKPYQDALAEQIDAVEGQRAMAIAFTRARENEYPQFFKKKPATTESGEGESPHNEPSSTPSKNGGA